MCVLDLVGTRVGVGVGVGGWSWGWVIWFQFSLCFYLSLGLSAGLQCCVVAFCSNLLSIPFRLWAGAWQFNTQSVCVCVCAVLFAKFIDLETICVCCLSFLGLSMIFFGIPVPDTTTHTAHIYTLYISQEIIVFGFTL